MRDRLDYLYHGFGQDRVMFGTDYPDSYGAATIAEEVALMKRCFSTKSREASSSPILHEIDLSVSRRH